MDVHRIRPLLRRPLQQRPGLPAGTLLEQAYAEKAERVRIIRQFRQDATIASLGFREAA
jgi:hypothetical protein